MERRDERHWEGGRARTKRERRVVGGAKGRASGRRAPAAPRVLCMSVSHSELLDILVERRAASCWRSYESQAIRDGARGIQQHDAP